MGRDGGGTRVAGSGGHIGRSWADTTLERQRRGSGLRRELSRTINGWSDAAYPLICLPFAAARGTTVAGGEAGR